VAAAAISHWPLDALVHRPELPLAGATSPTVGLGLWNHMPVALATEAAIVVLGLTRFVRGADLSRGKIIALTILNLVIPGFTLAGMTIAPAPPSALAMAGSSLASIAALCALPFWFGKSAS
jgi:hypothetical protein